MDTDISGCSLFIIIFIVCQIICAPFVLELNILYRNGEHTGYVTAVGDNSGLLPDRTTTVYVKTELSSSQEDTYCVQDSEVELISKLKEAARAKTNIIIQYKAYSFTGLFNCEGDRITDITSR